MATVEDEPPPATADVYVPTLSTSPFITVRQTENAGRGVFAAQRIAAGTHLHTSESPTAFVVYREYRREVCAECFAYDRGVVWKLRDQSLGVVWCSESCETAWRSRFDQEGDAGCISEAVEAMVAVERLVSKAKGWNNGDWDAVMLDSAGSKPSEDDILTAWTTVEEGLGRQIYSCRWRGEGAVGDIRPTAKATKQEKKAIATALSEPPAPDILSYLLSAVLAARFSPSSWTELLNLHAAAGPYTSKSVLHQHTCAYLQLLAVLPAPLLPSVTPEVLIAASTRDSHNSFGLRSLDDGGSEMFGFGVWPSASYWNHSCSPNVKKWRAGRAWHFETSTVVEEGQELCITYLGGEEKELDVVDRRKRLYEIWGFVCTCVRCTEESR